MGRLDNKVAVVVGGGQTPGETIGNGRATAIRFAEEGAQVVVLDRSLTSAEETVALIADTAGKAEARSVDVTNESQCVAVIDAIVSAHGRIDVLHYNVGIGTGDAGPARIDGEIWDSIFEANAKGAMHMCKAVLPHMRDAGRGVITTISSVAAVASATNISAYKASKAALNAYTQAVALSQAKYGIRANAILPGLMETPMAIEGFVAAGQDRAELVAQRNAAVPLSKKMGTGWDVANAALFLASDEAQFITGVLLPVDGGQAAKIG